MSNLSNVDRYYKDFKAVQSVQHAVCVLIQLPIRSIVMKVPFDWERRRIINADKVHQMKLLTF